MLSIFRRGRHSAGAAPVVAFLRVAAYLCGGLLAAGLVAAILLPRITDVEIRTVVSGSMSPALEPGDLIIASATEDARVGDIVVFPNPDKPDQIMAHRVVDDTGAGLVTRGDANNGEDPWIVDERSVLGVVAAGIPKIGYLIAASQSRLGILLTLVLPSLVILVGEVRVWVRFIVHGAEGFEDTVRGRHVAARFST